MMYAERQDTMKKTMCLMVPPAITISLGGVAAYGYDGKNAVIYKTGTPNETPVLLQMNKDQFDKENAFTLADRVTAIERLH